MTEKKVKKTNEELYEEYREKLDKKRFMGDFVIASLALHKTIRLLTDTFDDCHRILHDEYPAEMRAEDCFDNMYDSLLESINNLLAVKFELEMNNCFHGEYIDKNSIGNRKFIQELQREEALKEEAYDLRALENAKKREAVKLKKQKLEKEAKK